MRRLILCTLAAGTLHLLASCANEPSAPKQDDRIGGTAGVNFTSRNMSRVAPSRPTEAPPN